MWFLYRHGTGTASLQNHSIRSGNWPRSPGKTNGWHAHVETHWTGIESTWTSHGRNCAWNWIFETAGSCHARHQRYRPLVDTVKYMLISICRIHQWPCQMAFDIEHIYVDWQRGLSSVVPETILQVQETFIRALLPGPILNRIVANYLLLFIKKANLFILASF